MSSTIRGQLSIIKNVVNDNVLSKKKKKKEEIETLSRFFPPTVD